MSSYRMKYKIGATQYHIPVMDDISGFGSGVPLGTVLPYSANSQYPPEGFLWCDGSAVSRTAYPDLFALIGTLYGEGDGVSTFNLPNLNMGEFLEGSSTAGTAKEAGMPNVKGTLWARQMGVGNYSIAAYSDNGALYESGTYNTNLAYLAGNTASSGKPTFISLDASRSSSIYKNDVTTVQPKSVTVKFIIKAFSATSSNSELVDVTALSTEITKKADYRTDFCYVYPNNGTAENPANVSLNSTYIVSNPFSGYVVRCSAELYCWDEWVEAPFVYHFWSNDHRTVGLISLQNVANDCILVITGTNGMVTGKSNVSIFPNSCLVADRGSSDISTPLPCRVKVWKIGKIPT